MMQRAWLKLAMATALVWVVAAGAFAAPSESCCDSAEPTRCACGCPCVLDTPDPDSTPDSVLTVPVQVALPEATAVYSAPPAMVAKSWMPVCQGFLPYRPRAPDLGRAPPSF